MSELIRVSAWPIINILNAVEIAKGNGWQMEQLNIYYDHHHDRIGLITDEGLQIMRDKGGIETINN